jgi:hypothetical protein
MLQTSSTQSQGPAPNGRRGGERVRGISGLFALALAACSLVAGVVDARPERFRAGHPYYSDDFTVDGVVRDLAEEKNYEEVYQAYRYYEAVSDDRGRVVIFRKYQRGGVAREDRYRYEGEGTAPVEHTVAEDGGPPEPAPKQPTD